MSPDAVSQVPKSAIAMAKALEEGQASSVGFCGALFARIGACEPEIGAWAHLNRRITLRDAMAADERAARGKRLSVLDGVPIGIKDNIDTVDFPTEMGSPIHVGRRPQADAAIVEQLKALGLVVLGKTVTTPFGMNAPAPTRNPINPRHTLGASSVGSAAAVAAGMVLLTVNTQNTSSSTRPASYSGVFAFKPTHGALPLKGTLALSPPVTHLAFMAASLEDLKCLASLLLPSHMRADNGRAGSLALVRGPWWDRAEPEAIAGLESFASERPIRKAIQLPTVFEQAIRAHHAVIAGDMSFTLAAEYARHRAGLPEEAVAWIEQGLAMKAPDYVAALRFRETLYDALDDAMGDIDVVVTLATPGPAPHIGGGLGDGTFSMPWTFCGVPTLTLPLLRNAAGLPFGVQLIARRNCDHILFSAARRLASEAEHRTAGSAAARFS